MEKRYITKSDIDNAFDKKMLDSHTTPQMNERYKRGNKYYENKRRVKRLRDICNF